MRAPDPLHVPHVEILLRADDRRSGTASILFGTVRVTKLSSLHYDRGVTHPVSKGSFDDPSSYKLPRWSVSAHIDSESTFIARADGSDIPSLVISELSPYPRFASSCLCVISDRHLGGQKLVLIPCWEVLRYYYCAYGALSRYLFSGDFSRNTLFDLFDRIRFDGNRFTSRQLADGYFGNYAAYDAYAAHQAAEIFRRAVVSQAKYAVAAIQAVPPVLGTVDLTCQAVPYRTAGLDALLVLRIIDSHARERYEHNYSKPTTIAWGREPTTQFEQGREPPLFSASLFK